MSSKKLGVATKGNGDTASDTADRATLQANGRPKASDSSALRSSDAHTEGSFSKSVLKAFTHHKKLYAQQRRAKVDEQLAKNKAALASHLKFQLSQWTSLPDIQILKTSAAPHTRATTSPPPAPTPLTGGISAAAQPCALTKVVKLAGNVTIPSSGPRLPLYALELPCTPAVPPYKSWEHVTTNVYNPAEVGRRMFYDDLGETVPASDDEESDEPERRNLRALNGVKRGAVEYALLHTVQQYGTEEEVLRPLADKLDATVTGLRARAEQLLCALRKSSKGQQGGAAGDASMVASKPNGAGPCQPQTWQEMEGEQYSMLCRRCRTFGCLLHGGSHVRPVLGPIHSRGASQGLDPGRGAAATAAGGGEGARAEPGAVGSCLEAEPGRQGTPTSPGGAATELFAWAAGAAAPRPAAPCGPECYLLQGPGQGGARGGGSRGAVPPREGPASTDAQQAQRREGGQGGSTGVPASGVPGAVGGSPLGEGGDDRVAPSRTKLPTARSRGRLGDVEGPLPTPKGLPPLSRHPKKQRLSPSSPTIPSVAALLKRSAAGLKSEGGAAPFPAPSSAAPGPGRGSVACAAVGGPRGEGGGGEHGRGGHVGSAGANALEVSGSRPDGRGDGSEPAEHSGRTKEQARGSAAHPASSTSPAAAAAAAAATAAPPRRPSSEGMAMAGAGGHCGVAVAEGSGGGGADGWEEWEEGALQAGMEIWGRHPCRVALLVHTKTCRQVHQRLLQRPPPSPPPPPADHPLDKSKRRRKQNVAKKQQAAVTWQRLKRVKEGNTLWQQYQPCGCVGPCRQDCPCVGDDNFCEKYCGCDPSQCGNRQQGCTCGKSARGRCTLKSCSCLAAGRECDPDLCKGCAPTVHGQQQEGWRCHNMRLRLGQRKRVLMGLSEVQGWGAFLKEPAKEGDFVGEYTGELIDHGEADRRGKTYDRDDNSYLFNLNLSWVVDARQKGNKLRFANHSTNANCRPEILMVDGDHRVAILAKRDLGSGDEIFYDYNYDKIVAPDWAQRSERQGDMQRGQHGQHAAKKQASSKEMGRGR